MDNRFGWFFAVLLPLMLRQWCRCLDHNKNIPSTAHNHTQANRLDSVRSWWTVQPVWMFHQLAPVDFIIHSNLYLSTCVGNKAQEESTTGADFSLCCERRKTFWNWALDLAKLLLKWGCSPLLPFFMLQVFTKECFNLFKVTYTVWMSLICHLFDKRHVSVWSLLALASRSVDVATLVSFMGMNGWATKNTTAG